MLGCVFVEGAFVCFQCEWQSYSTVVLRVEEDTLVVGLCLVSSASGCGDQCSPLVTSASSSQSTRAT